ncbi:divalent-cation tolerance protein CutA [Desulfococcaceae bacterium HSG9]|nr:divalent-cation tolerance protein CutA [Desulfococcaceae bacterium HSG9]
MVPDGKYCLVLSTCPNNQEADKLARSLVESHLAACVQITGITSYYEWKNEVNKDEERLLLIKTLTERYDEIEQFITQHHSYDVPEIITIPIHNGSDAYLNWIGEIVKNPAS